MRSMLKRQFDQGIDSDWHQVEAKWQVACARLESAAGHSRRHQMVSQAIDEILDTTHDVDSFVAKCGASAESPPPFVVGVIRLNQSR